MKTLTRVRVSCYQASFRRSVSGRFLSDSQTNWECHVFEKHRHIPFRRRVAHVRFGSDGHGAVRDGVGSAGWSGMWERNGREWERTGRDGNVSRRFASDWKRFSRGYRPVRVPVRACPVFSPWCVAGFPCLLGICGGHAQESPLIPVLHETITWGFGDGHRSSERP